jgi:nitroimidazol reductase NimA-like FMN-containing flavoprotein (pyridoxamine 5'-phosphate oxidase superfamily)
VDLEAKVRSVIDDNVYMVLGTADETGRPWAAPVFYVADAYRELYWISSPEVTHSRQLARRPEVGIVIFDSRAPLGQGNERAVYLAATAAEVAPDDLERTLAEFPGFARSGGRDRGPAELLPPNAYRLYRATVTEHSVACPRPDGQPCPAHGHAYDHRLAVELGSPTA